MDPIVDIRQAHLRNELNNPVRPNNGSRGSMKTIENRPEVVGEQQQQRQARRHAAHVGLAGERPDPCAGQVGGACLLVGAGALAHGPLHQARVARLRRLERRSAASELVGGRRHGFAQLLDLGPQRRRAALGPGGDPAAGARGQDHERGDQRHARGRTDGHGGTSRACGRVAVTSAPPQPRCSGSIAQVGLERPELQP